MYFFHASFYVKIKGALVQALRLCTGRTAHRGSRGKALPLLDHGTRRGWVVSVTPRPLFTPRKDPVPIVQEAGWSSGAENLAPTGIRSPDRPARSQSLYRLSYPARFILCTEVHISRTQTKSCHSFPHVLPSSRRPRSHCPLNMISFREAAILHQHSPSLYSIRSIRYYPPISIINP